MIFGSIDMNANMLMNDKRDEMCPPFECESLLDMKYLEFQQYSVQ